MSMSDAAKNLRLAVIRLRSLHSDDFEAVMSNLDKIERGHVLRLLQEFEGRQDEVEEVTSAVSVSSTVVPDVSPWLLARIKGEGETVEGATNPFQLTPATQQALRECAAVLAVEGESGGARQMSLMGRVWKRIGKW